MNYYKIKLTQNDGDFLVGLGKWIGNAVLRIDNEGSIYTGS